MYHIYVFLRAFFLAQNATQIHYNGVDTSQQKYVYPVFHQTTEKIWFWWTRPGLGIPRCKRKSSGGQAEIHNVMQGQIQNYCSGVQLMFNMNHEVTFPWFYGVQELLGAYEAEGTATGRTRLLVSAAVAAGKGTIDAGYEIAEMAKYIKNATPNIIPMISCHHVWWIWSHMHFNRYLDFINVMTYDFHGTWEHVTGHHSPLYKGSQDTGDHVYLNTVSTEIHFSAALSTANLLFLLSQ